MSTILSIINGTDCIGATDAACTGGTAVGALHYRYISKPIVTADPFLDPSAACQKKTRFGLVGYVPQLSQLGVYDRNEAFQSGGQYIHVRCVAGIDLASLLGAAFVTPSSTFSTTGGWAVTNLLSALPLNTDEIIGGVTGGGPYDAFVFDLKFGAVTPLIASPAGSAMVNDSKPIRTRALPAAPRITPDPGGA